MADLQSDRVSAGNIDLSMLPLWIILDLYRLKSEGPNTSVMEVLLCLRMATRAVHLEVTESLETSAFPDAFF